MDIQEQIFKAIDIITDQKMSQLPFNQTIEGIISSSVQNEDGSYNFYYQDLELTAFPMNNVKYTEGEIVYVMAVSGDLSKKKVIITSKNRDGALYIDINAELEKLSRAGINYITEQQPVYMLPSGTSEVPLKLMPEFIEDAIAQTHILIAAQISSSLTATVGASYGVELKIKHQNGTIQDYALTLNEVTGDPYNAKGSHRTIEALYPDSPATELISARVYIKGFPEAQVSQYVVFSDIRVEFIQQTLVDIEKSTAYKIEIVSSNGMVFRNGLVSTKLSAKVFKGTAEVTHQIGDDKFRWSKILDNGDVIYDWVVGKKSIDISETDVMQRATFICEVDEF